MAHIPPANQKLWQEYVTAFQASSDQPEFHSYPDKEDWSWFELKYNGRTLKYTVKVIGTQPPEGFPLFIGLHGGGGPTNGDDRVKTLEKNDASWRSMTDYWYRKPVEDHVTKTKEGAVYISARGVSTLDGNGDPEDTWNLHFQPESYFLLQRMIRGFFLPTPTEATQQHVEGPFNTSFSQEGPFVDPNRVHLLGFSAGGDGAFQHAARIPDVFSAVSAAGGHPNGVTFTNTTNLPFCISSGEKDTLPSGYKLSDKDSSGAQDRAWEIARDSFQLVNLRKSLREQLYSTIPKLYHAKVSDYPFYPYNCIIAQGKGHNSWAGPEMTKEPQKVLTNLKSWLFKQENHDTETDGADAATDKIIDLVDWASSSSGSSVPIFKPRVRKALPDFVVWDLAVRPTAPGSNAPGKEKAEWTPKNTLYWLYLRSNDTASLKDKVYAAYDRATNSVWVNNATESLGLLLNGDMLDFGKEVWVCIGKEKADAQKIKITPSEKLRKETLWQRGDPSWVFDALVYFEKSGDKWVAKVTDTLKVDQTLKIKSKL